MTQWPGIALAVVLLTGCGGGEPETTEPACLADEPCETLNPCEVGRTVCTAEGEAQCVGDGPMEPGILCRPAEGPCDEADVCDGIGVDCPPDGFLVDVECRTAQGPCDVPELCDGLGIACPSDAVAPATEVCREAVDGCDIAETCTGVTPTCPDDGFAPTGTDCPIGFCDGSGECAEGCEPGEPCSTGQACGIGEVDCSTGVPACLPVGMVDAGTVCRQAAGSCDVEEVCDGASASCPIDAFRGAATECRPAGADPCGRAEACDGSGPQCPTDLDAPDGTRCTDNDACTYAFTTGGPPWDACSSGVCGGTNTTTCPDGAGTCAVNRTCDGHGGCIESYPSAITSCGNCGQCSGAGTCRDCPPNQCSCGPWPECDFAPCP